MAASFALSASAASSQVTIQPEFRTAPRSLITQKVDRHRMALTQGALNPIVAKYTDLGEVDAALPIEHIQLLLQRPAERQAAFDAQVEALHTQGSPSFHKWLTPEIVGSEFGPSASDVQTISAYLQTEGFTVNNTGKSGLYIDFTGTAAQVESTFQTKIHRFDVPNPDNPAEVKYSAVQQASIPEALMPAIVGLVSLSNILSAHTNYRKAVPAVQPPSQIGRDDASPLDTVSTSNYAEGPQDFYTIYNENTLLTQASPINGAGVTIALLEESAITSSDVTTFRTTFGVTPNAPVSLVVDTGYGTNTCTAPTLLKASGEEGEAILDIEWAGAVAPQANLIFMQCAAGAVLGVFYSAEAVIDNNLADTMSLSYGEYEGYNTTQDSLATDLWEQAASQGETVVVSAGDSGAASEDGLYGDKYAKYGVNASSFSTTAWNVSAGGTDFMDYFDQLQNDTGYEITNYWNSTNGTGLSSAKSYIPEMTWNDSCGSSVYSFHYYGVAETNPATFCGAQAASSHNIAGGGGAPSTLHTRPSWQTGTVYGLPTTTAYPQRLQPDVSLFASNGFWYHDLPSYESDEGTSATSYAGGTSFVAPQLAGVFALIKQATGERLGQPNYVLYNMAGTEYGTTTATGACNSSGSTNNGLTASPVAKSTPASSCIFYDITAGTSSVVCSSTGVDCYYVSGKTYGILSTSATSTTTGAPAFAAGTGWDQTTGIGSLNITNLVNNWQNATYGYTPTATVALTTSAASVTYGSTTAITYTATVSGTGSYPTGSVTFSGTSPIGAIGTADALAASSACTTGGTCVESTTQTFTPHTTAPGTYTITATYATTNENYPTKTGTVGLTINPNPSTISFSIASPQHTEFPTSPPTIALSATSNGTGAFTYSVTSGPATISGTTLTITGAGSVIVQVSQASDSTYSTTTANASFTVLAGSVWAGNSSGSLSTFDLLGNVLSPNTTGFTGGGTGTIPATLSTAFDSTGNLWIASTNGVSKFSASGVAITSSAYTTAGISNPLSLAIDGLGQIWTANTSGSVSVLTNAGAAVSPTTTGYTYSSTSLGTPGSLAIDLSGNVWVSNTTDNSVTEYIGAANPVAPLSTGVAQKTTGALP